MCVCKKLHCEVCGNQIDASAELIKERDALRAQIESIRNDQLYIAAANERDALRAAVDMWKLSFYCDGETPEKAALKELRFNQFVEMVEKLK